MRPQFTSGFAHFLWALLNRKYERELAEKEIAHILLVPGPVPRGLGVKRLGIVEEPDPWPPDAARRLIRHQAKKLGANRIYEYREEATEHRWHIRCRGLAVFVDGLQ